MIQREKIEAIQALYQRHWEAFTREMQSVVSTPSPEDERQIQEAIQTVIGRSQERATGLGVMLAEQMEGIAPKLLSMADSQEKKDRIMEVLTHHLHAQLREISEILIADLRNK